MFAALAASLMFTLTYATLAAKSRRAEMVLIPLLDVLQSVPILGVSTFTVVFFVSLFPGGARAGTGRHLRHVHQPGLEHGLQLSTSRYTYRVISTRPQGLSFLGVATVLEAGSPFAMPGLVWNMMMSMSGGWFFVVAAEAISVGTAQ